MNKNKIYISLILMLCLITSVVAYNATWDFEEGQYQGLDSNAIFVNKTIMKNSINANFSDGVTIEVVFKPTTRNQGYLVHKPDTFLFQVEAGGKIQGGLYNKTKYWLPLVTGNRVNTTGYNVVVLTYDNKVMKLYQDGKLASSKSYVGKLNNFKKDIYFFSRYDNTRQLVAYVDEIEIIDRALTEQEIKVRYNRTVSILNDSKIIYQENAQSVKFWNGTTITQDNFTDGNWSTFLNDNYLMKYYFNYTKPTDSTGAIWQVKNSLGTVNYTIPIECFNAYDNYVSLGVGAGEGDMDYECQTFIDLGQNANSIQLNVGLDTNIYEEGVYWIKEKYTYQENANETDCVDASCDGDWSTSAYSANYANYAKPAWATRAIWQVSDDCGVNNISITQSCWNYDANKLLLSYFRGEGFGGVHYYCANETLREVEGCGDLKEEGIYWIGD